MDSADLEGSVTSSVNSFFATGDLIGGAYRPRPGLYSRPGFYFLHDCSDPRALNEAGFYSREGSIRAYTVYHMKGHLKRNRMAQISAS